jgi:ADP-ribose pyrophosphatase
MDAELRERLISSRRVFEGRLLAVQVDEVELPGGRRAQWEIVAGHPGAAVIVPLLPEGKVVMLRHYRHAAGKVLWELPAGILNPGESPEQCAGRELTEETGYTAGKLRHLFSTYLTPGCSNEIAHFFLATDLSATGTAPAEDEPLELVILPLSEAVAMVGRGEVQNASAVCGLLAVARWGGEAGGAIE